jgi:hypothetical protein
MQMLSAKLILTGSTVIVGIRFTNNSKERASIPKNTSASTTFDRMTGSTLREQKPEKRLRVSITRAPRGHTMKLSVVALDTEDMMALERTEHLSEETSMSAISTTLQNLVLADSGTPLPSVSCLAGATFVRFRGTATQIKRLMPSLMKSFTFTQRYCIHRALCVGRSLPSTLLQLLIADDRLVLMGSANLNDRSQLGDHDSEIACIIEDPTPLPSHMNGRRYTAAHFAATLRRQIFRKHLGLIPAQNFHTEDANMLPVPVPNIYDFDSPEDRLVEDPLSDEFWGFWNQTAKVNTDVFAKVFHAVPHDSVTNWKMYDEYWTKYFVAPKVKNNKDGEPEPEPMIKWGHVVKPNFSPGAQGAKEVREILSAIRGHLVEMPLDFLKEEDIAKEGLGLNALTETLYT